MFSRRKEQIFNLHKYTIQHLNQPKSKRTENRTKLIIYYFNFRVRDGIRDNRQPKPLMAHASSLPLYNVPQVVKNMFCLLQL